MGGMNPVSDLEASFFPILCQRMIEVDMELVSPEPHAPAGPPYPHAESGLNPCCVPARPTLIKVRDLRKEYSTGRGRLVLFDGLSFEVAEGELLAIVGESGAGKSTLLHILGALDTPTAGDVYCASIQLSMLSARQAAAFRNRDVGYVWQFHYLLPEFTAAENVAIPLLARGERRIAALRKAQEWLDEVELADRRDHRPAAFRHRQRRPRRGAGTLR